MREHLITELIPVRAQIVISEPTKTRKGRSCSFKNRNPSTLDLITVEIDGKLETLTIPAISGTIYWAGLQYMYQNINRKVYVDEFCRAVETIMLECRPDKWEKYVDKRKVRTVKDKATVLQDASPWTERLVTNFRNICRVGGDHPYGKRLTERGHLLVYETELDRRGFFILKTGIDQGTLSRPRRGRKPKITIVIGE